MLTLATMSCSLLFFLAIAIIHIAASDEAAQNATSSAITQLSLGRGQVDHNKIYNEDVVKNGDSVYYQGGTGGGGGGGGGGSWWKWGCSRQPKSSRHRSHRKWMHDKEEYVMGEFAQCMVKGRCKGMRLDCPLHCGGPCLYDCRYMCKAHCRR
ncbi:hypothetical protein EUGRSUZ_F01845 [Eucalyptus grandis]|uniref:Uncharacterized protein n=2 Tax=Eucalyptus grandis TaxID=71139 RepID=A0ACC3KG58_EUCGR|nr:hypothetical protein EUGRSUZ_F01845 [Eucalyptus grandis]